MYVLLFKDSANSQAYLDALPSSCQGQFLPVLQFAYKYDDSVKNLFKGDLTFNTIVLTSHRSASVFRSLYCSYLEANPASSTLLSAFCVGERTASVIRDLPGINLLAVEINANELVPKMQILHETTMQDMSILFFCGDKRLNAIPNFCRERNIQLQEHIVYQNEAVPPHEIVNALASALHLSKERGHEDVALVFFSPTCWNAFRATNTLSTTDNIESNSGHNGSSNEFTPAIESSYVHIKLPEGTLVQQVKLVAIGQTTANVITNSGFVCNAIAATPNANGVSDAICSLV